MMLTFSARNNVARGTSLPPLSRFPKALLQSLLRYECWGVTHHTAKRPWGVNYSSICHHAALLAIEERTHISCTKSLLGIALVVRGHHVDGVAASTQCARRWIVSQRARCCTNTDSINHVVRSFWILDAGLLHFGFGFLYSVIISPRPVTSLGLIIGGSSPSSSAASSPTWRPTMVSLTAVLLHSKHAEDRLAPAGFKESENLTQQEEAEEEGGSQQEKQKQTVSIGFHSLASATGERG